jgi:hypothetical protein
LLAWWGVHGSPSQLGKYFLNLASCLCPPTACRPADFPHGFRICTEGISLLKGSFLSPASALADRNAYNNQMEAKFAKEEEKSFHVHLPHCFLFFINGLMINPIQWAVRKGKCRICIDCTNGPDGADTNSSATTCYIPGLKENETDTCPPVPYASTFLRHLQHLWHTCITFPVADILQHCDDIDAAFCRILYNPKLAIVFAYVFGLFLLIPVGQVLGSRSAPSYFSLMSDIQAFVSTCPNLITRYPMHLLALTAKLPPVSLLVDLAPAIADSRNPPPLSLLGSESHSNITFVDDNGVLDLQANIKTGPHMRLSYISLILALPSLDA